MTAYFSSTLLCSWRSTQVQFYWFVSFGYPRFRVEVIQGWHFQKNLFAPTKVCCLRPLLAFPNPITKMLGAQSSLHIVTENKARALRKIGSSFPLVQAVLNWYKSIYLHWVWNQIFESYVYKRQVTIPPVWIIHVVCNGSFKPFCSTWRLAFSFSFFSLNQSLFWLSFE